MTPISHLQVREKQTAFPQNKVNNWFTQNDLYQCLKSKESNKNVKKFMNKTKLISFPFQKSCTSPVPSSNRLHLNFIFLKSKQIFTKKLWFQHQLVILQSPSLTLPKIVLLMMSLVPLFKELTLYKRFTVILHHCYVRNHHISMDFLQNLHQSKMRFHRTCLPYQMILTCLYLCHYSFQQKK